MRPDAADPVRAGHHRERDAHGGVLREAKDAPGELLLPVQEGPQHAALRQLPQRQEGLRRLQGAPAQVLSARSDSDPARVLDRRRARARAPVRAHPISRWRGSLVLSAVY